MVILHYVLHKVFMELYVEDDFLVEFIYVPLMTKHHNLQTMHLRLKMSNVKKSNFNSLSSINL